MKKKLIALLATCTMLTTVAAGMVQTAYAVDPNIRIEVSDGATDTQKILTFYYEGVEGVLDIQGKLTFTGGTVSIDSYSVTIECDNSQTNKNTGVLYFTSDYGTSSEDGSFATATITVPSDVDITANFAVTDFEDLEWENYGSDVGTVSVVIPKKSETPPEPVVAKSVEESAAYTKADGYDANVVVGTIQLSVTGAAIDLTAATYKGKTPTDVTGDNVTTFQGEALITVIINGETSTDALNQVVFN